MNGPQKKLAQLSRPDHLYFRTSWYDEGIILRKLQQAAGTYPRPSIACLWRKSFHICILGYVESVPGVCWSFVRTIGLADPTSYALIFVRWYPFIHTDNSNIGRLFVMYINIPIYKCPASRTLRIACVAVVMVVLMMITRKWSTCHHSRCQVAIFRLRNTIGISSKFGAWAHASKA